MGGRGWFETVPGWLRWIIALPVVAILEAVIVRKLEGAGLRDFSNSIIFPVAIALTIFVAAHIAATAARSYRKQVGFAIALAELAIVCQSYLAFVTFGSTDSLFFPPRKPIEFFAVILIGVAATIASLVVKRFPIDEPFPAMMPGGEVGVRRWLGISVAVGASAAFEAIGIGVAALSYPYFSAQAANALSAVICSGIVVTLIVDFEPARKKAAAWIVGGVYLTPTIASIVYGALLLPRIYPYGLDLWLVGNAIILSSATMVGALLGLQAVWTPIKSERLEN